MMAGRMRSMLVTYQPTTVTGASGAETITFEEYATIHAERVKLSGRLQQEVAEIFSGYDAEYNVRYAHAVAEGWRVQDKQSGILYYVCNVIPNFDKGYKTLKCSRVNE